MTETPYKLINDKEVTYHTKEELSDQILDIVYSNEDVTFEWINSYTLKVL